MLNFRPLCRMEVELAEPLDLGVTPVGHRRVINITGGRFAGDRVSGSILTGGADWQVLHPDGLAVLDARYTLRTESGDLVQVSSQGLRHGPPEIMAKLARGEPVDQELYYFRTALRFETGAGSLAWLNRIIGCARGVRTRNLVELEAFELL
jgi:hypothetical protein